MDDQPTIGQPATLRSIAWRDLCPWLMLFRCPGIALRASVLSLATAGGVLTALAWVLSGWIFYFGNPAEIAEDHATEFDTAAEHQQAVAFGRLHRQLSRLPGAPADVIASPSDAVDSDDLRTARAYHETSLAVYLWATITGDARDRNPVDVTWRQTTRPYLEILSLRLTGRQFGYLLVGGLLTLLIWSIFGGAITRIAAMGLAREERIGAMKALRFAAGKVLSYFASPLLPLLALAAFALGVFLIVGLPMNADAGLIWSGLIWILVLAIGLLVGVLLSGLFFGWPLMWATISTEGTDTFDALSRTYAYTFQRPLHYLLYAVLAGALGALVWLLVWVFAEAVIHICWWSADWGVFNETRMEAIVAAANANQSTVDRLAEGGSEAGSQIDSPGHVGIYMFRFANGLLRAVAYSFAYGYFWVTATAIYLLLRRDVDHTETDEVFPDDDFDSYGLPPLTSDEAGVPMVDKEAGEPDVKEDPDPSDSRDDQS